MSPEELVFEQIHIDVARNSTDDFNPFHDPLRWNTIAGNPFPAPIALGFQLEFLASDRIMQRRADEGIGGGGCGGEGLGFRNFDFNFAGALAAGEAFEIDVRKTVDKTPQGGSISNRVAVRKANGTPVLIGVQSHSTRPRVQTEIDLDLSIALDKQADRSFVDGSELFFKRKYLNTSNAKNFALGALCRQHDYVDELAERVHFSPLFTASLISCALLERGTVQGHNFEVEPMVYTSHQISVDLSVQNQLSSNDALHLLVSPPSRIQPGKGLGRACVEQQLFLCSALTEEGKLLFQAQVQLAPLTALSGLRSDSGSGSGSG